MLADPERARHGSLAAGWIALSSSVRAWWTTRGSWLLPFFVLFLAALALLKLGDEFRRLLWEQAQTGAIDLRALHGVTHDWFRGRPVYKEWTAAVHLPATYTLLWPFLGWLPLSPARWLWALTTILAMGWMCYFVVQATGAEGKVEIALVALMALSMNATGVTVGNGQLTIHLLAVILAGVLVLRPGNRTWTRDLLAALMFLVALAKMPVGLPFLLPALLAFGATVPVTLALAGYGALSLFAVSFQDAGIPELVNQWMARSSALAAAGGYGNLHIWLVNLGLGQWIFLASALVLVLLGVWIWCHRRCDLWLLLGVTAIVARLWTYHRLYDDLLILFPMISLFRIAKRGSSEGGHDVLAGVLLVTTIVAMLAPARLGYAPWPWFLIFTTGHVLVWIAVLVFLMAQARRERAAWGS